MNGDGPVICQTCNLRKPCPCDDGDIPDPNTPTRPNRTVLGAVRVALDEPDVEVPMPSAPMIPAPPSASVGPCLTGCTVRGEHGDDCPGRCSCAPNRRHRASCDGTCRGCKPRQAACGQLCAWCWNRLVEAVAGLPALVAHLRVLGDPDASAAPYDESGATPPHRPAEGNVLPAEWLAADDLHVQLAAWARMVREDHPAGRAMKGPDDSAVVYAPSRIHRLDPLLYPNLDASEREHVHRGEPVAITDHTATGHLAAWITPWLPWIADRPWAGEITKGFVRDVATTRHRWPTADDTEPRHTVDVPCPRCGLMSLTYTPPRHERQPFVVECTDPDCARVFSEDEWERFQALALRSAGA